MQHELTASVSSSPVDKPGRRAPLATAAAVLAFLWLIGIVTGAQLRMAPTFDEQNHVTRGISVLRTGDYRLILDHPPLANILEALPVAWNPAVGFSPSLPSWDPAHLNIWDAAHATIWRIPAAGIALIHLARVPVLCFALLLAAVVFLWARELFGPWGGVLALGWLVLDPSILAHSGLATTDLAVTATLVFAVYLLRRYLVQPSHSRLLAAGAGLGLALTTKFSALILLPIIGLLLLLLACRPPASGLLPGFAALPLARRIRRMAAIFLAILLVGGVVLWGVYGFHVEPLGSKLGRPLPAHAGLRAHIPVPAMQFLRGLKTVRNHAEIHPAYLLGQTHASGKGWWYYFPVAIAAKTPLPELLALLGMLGVLLSPRVRKGLGLPAYELWLLLLPAGVYLLASLGVLGISLNLGIRHILPLFPFLCILAGGWVALPWRQQAVRPVVLAALAAQLVSILLVYPNFLAYFNEPAGGANRGYRVLIDSNFDWGQDIGELAAFQRAHPGEKLYFSYFGTTPPAAYGIACSPLAGLGVMHHAPAPDWRAMHGFIAVSATNLYGGAGYVYPDRAEVKKDNHRAIVPPIRTKIVPPVRANADEDYHRLLTQTPYARAGDTIFIYRLP